MITSVYMNYHRHVRGHCDLSRFRRQRFRGRPR